MERRGSVFSFTDPGRSAFRSGRVVLVKIKKSRLAQIVDWWLFRRRKVGAKAPASAQSEFVPGLLVTALILSSALGHCPRGVAALPAFEEASPVPSQEFGVLFWHDSPNDIAALSGIRQALRERGKPHELLVRSADSNPERARELLKDFALAKVTLIFAMGTEAALAARKENLDIPVVFTAVTNPVVSGVVPDWSGSKSNVAGNSNWIGPDTVLRVFRQAVPGLTRLGILRSRASGRVSSAELEAMRHYLAQEKAPRVEIFESLVEEIDALDRAVEKLASSGVQAIWIPIDFSIYQNLPRVLEVAQPRGIPLVSSSLKGAQAGAVAGILVDYELLGRRAVVIALSILEGGAPPGDLPVETMSGYHVVVNLDAAHRCGYELPLSLLALADRILEDEGKTDSHGN